ncbi:multisubunit sodium/proton antiporter, MrpD subunit (TC 2.A.63.1) [Halogranum rubrum]|uniref:Multisubunit sodium/proton antiporter, MrpD subunit (TC 2.A.63.1) n=1 Tax=Halogranum rubrum TaxID=553466 RepID=A0A1I4ELI8_9EURY|nr:Na(+)/H(+) antiporter subunit D [Halogranum rubrum]SFL06149.1 multisubunit sodium/proton antiporter, MrpD subunit (TC 2.A.63.1) [Halogranum rubrum]
MEALTAIPPFVYVLAVALLMPLLSRRVGHALGVLATGVVVPVALLTPEGAHWAVQLFSFDVVLFNVDEFSRLMGLIFGFIGAIAVLYSYATEASNKQTAYALTYVGTSIGAVFAGDWLTLVFFWELMAVTSTLLVWDYGGKAVRAGFRYAVLHGIGGSLVLAAIVWHYAEVGSFLFSASTGIVGAGPAVLALAAIGIGVNVGFVGLHAWLPDTYPRPHVAASVFLCVYTTKTGVYAMYRAFPEGHLWLAYMGGAMAVFGATMAVLQKDMRRLLSYHIQSQVGYMIAGIGIGTTVATAGAFGHVFNHILYKSLLFMTVGVVIYRTGEESLKYVGGLARDMPITAGAFVVAALSIAGFPGFNGFVSKGMIIAEAHYKHLDVVWYLLLAGGVGTFLSFIKLGWYAFYEGSYDGEVRDANGIQKVAMVSVAVLCIVYGFFPDALFAILPGNEGGFDYTTYTFGHVVEGLILAALGIVGFAILKKPLDRIGRVPDIDAIYNPLAFYGTRALVRGVTESYAAVDRAAVGVAGGVSTTLRNPETVVRRAVGREEADATGEDESAWPLSLHAGIGTSILLLTAVATVGIALLVVA